MTVDGLCRYGEWRHVATGCTTLVLMKQKVIGWQWHQLDHMQIICTSLQTDNRTGTSSLNFYRPDAFLMPNQQCQYTEGNIYHHTDTLCNYTILLVIQLFAQQQQVQAFPGKNCNTPETIWARAPA